MPEISGPLTNQPFTDAQWRAIIGAEPAIVGDMDGSAYKLTLSTNSDAAVLGSTTQDSMSVVAGFQHGILAGQTQSVTIPAATSAARTDLIVVRYNPAWTVAPGPCRLAVVSGTEGAGRPAYDATPPGMEDMPLWEVTRRPGQSLAQSDVEDLRVWTGPNLVTQWVDNLPSGAPLGTVVSNLQGARAIHRRVRDPQGAPTWTRTWDVKPTLVREVGGTAAGITSQNIISYTVAAPGYPFRVTVSGTLRVAVSSSADFVVSLRAAGVDVDQDELRTSGGVAHVHAVYQSTDGSAVNFALFLDRQAGAGTAAVTNVAAVNRLDLIIEPL